MPEPHPQTPGQHLGHRGHAAAQLAVALRAVGHRHVVAGVDVEVVAAEPDRVGGEHALVEQPQALEKDRDAAAVGRLDGQTLLAGLGQVDLDEAAGLGGQPGHRRQALDGQDVGRVGPHPHGDQAVPAVVVAVQAAGVVQAVLPAQPAPGEVEDPRGEHAADPRLERRLDDDATVEVHLRGGGDPGAQHLVGSRATSPSGCRPRSAPPRGARPLRAASGRGAGRHPRCAPGSSGCGRGC